MVGLVDRMLHLHKKLAAEHSSFYAQPANADSALWLQQGRTLTRIGGWANRLTSAGAGLFVVLWEVGDSGALKFAGMFYGPSFDGDSTWLTVSRCIPMHE